MYLPTTYSTYSLCEQNYFLVLITKGFSKIIGWAFFKGRYLGYYEPTTGTLCWNVKSSFEFELQGDGKVFRIFKKRVPTRKNEKVLDKNVGKKVFLASYLSISEETDLFETWEGINTYRIFCTGQNFGNKSTYSPIYSYLQTMGHE